MEAATLEFGPAARWIVMPMPEDVQPAFERVRSLAPMSPVVVLASSDCCMAAVVETFLHRLAVAQKLVEIEVGGEINSFLDWIAGISPEFRPWVTVQAVFVGGRYNIGGFSKVLGCHMRGHLVPILKDAGALWL